MGLTILDSDYMNMAYKFEYRFLNEKNTLTKEHNHNFYEYFIITNGELNHHIGKYDFHLKKGDMSLIRPKECHRLEIDTQKSFNMINISMCKDIFNQVYDYFGQTAIEDLINCEFPLTVSLSEKQLLSLIKKHELFYVVSGVRDSTILLKTLLSDVLYYFLTRHPSEREQRVLILHFGLQGSEVYSLEEIGKEIGLTRERVRQIESKAIRKLRAMKDITNLHDYIHL